MNTEAYRNDGVTKSGYLDFRILIFHLKDVCHHSGMVYQVMSI